MAAGGTKGITSASHEQQATILRARFGGTVEQVYLDWAFCRELNLRVGPQPSRAVVDIPLSDRVDTAPAVILQYGPLQDLKIGQRVEVTAVEEGASVYPLFCGSVTGIDHELASDGGAVTCLDDKWLLEGVNIFGVWYWIPSTDGSSGEAYFRHREPCIFNPGGRPNCLDATLGPLFAPSPFHGWKTTDTEPPAVGEAKTKARYWRIDDVLTYLRDVYYLGLWDLTRTYYQEYQLVDGTKVEWDGGWASMMAHDTFTDQSTTEIKDNDRELGTDAKAVNVDFDGWNLNAALDKLLTMVGGFGLYMLPAGDGKSRMAVRPKKWMPNAQEAALEINTDFSLWAPGAVSGNINFDGSEMYSSVIVHGDDVFLEKRVEWDPALALDHPAQTLWPAWSRPGPGDVGHYGVGTDYVGDTEEERFIHRLLNATIGTTDVSKTAKAWQMAVNEYPKVFAAYQINPNIEWEIGTKYEGDSVHVPLPPKLLGQLLTGISDDDGLAQQWEGSLRRFLPRPVVVESADNFGVYTVAEEINGAQIDEEGNIYFAALREASISPGAYSVGTWLGSYFDPSNIRPRKLRITMAWAMDNRTRMAIKTAAAPADVVIDKKGVGGMGLADPSGENEIAQGLPRQYLATTGDAYREYLRKNSWPKPESIDGAVVAPDHCMKGDELLYDKEWIEKHARRRLAYVSRAKRNGVLRFPIIVPWEPGQTVKSVNGYYVGACISGVKHTYGGKASGTELTLT